MKQLNHYTQKHHFLSHKNVSKVLSSQLSGNRHLLNVRHPIKYLTQLHLFLRTLQSMVLHLTWQETKALEAKGPPQGPTTSQLLVQGSELKFTQLQRNYIILNCAASPFHNRGISRDVNAFVQQSFNHFTKKGREFLNENFFASNRLNRKIRNPFKVH